MEYLVGDRITLIQMLGEKVMRMEGGWNWLRIVSIGGLWF
jgi:hypothetical protein